MDGQALAWAGWLAGWLARGSPRLQWLAGIQVGDDGAWAANNGRTQLLRTHRRTNSARAIGHGLPLIGAFEYHRPIVGGAALDSALTGCVRDGRPSLSLGGPATHHPRVGRDGWMGHAAAAASLAHGMPKTGPAPGYCVATLLTAQKKSCSLLKPACPLGLPCPAAPALPSPNVSCRVCVNVCVCACGRVRHRRFTPASPSLRCETSPIRRLLAASDDIRLLSLLPCLSATAARTLNHD